MKTENQNTVSKATEVQADNRSLRLLKIMSEIRNEPSQPLRNLLEKFGISRSQFYKDKDALASYGFSFEYRKAHGFRIIEDRLTPLNDLSLSDRVTLLFALEDLCASQDGILAAKAIEIARKLVGGLESPFREQLLHCFDHEVTHKAFGVNPDIFLNLVKAIKQQRRIKILYCGSKNWKESWRLIDPKRVYMRQHILYLYARSLDDTPYAWKVFRLSRIREIQETGISFRFDPNEDDGFYARQKNAFMSFLGDAPKPITIRFSGEAVPYIKEQQWHTSQQIEEQPDGSLLFSVKVAEPMEVVRWARQFGTDAEIVSMENNEP